MRITLLMILFSFNTLAFDIKSTAFDGISYYQKIPLQDDLVTAVVHNFEGNLRFNLFDSSNKKTVEFDMAPTEGFIGARVYDVNNYKNPIVATLWEKGVHGKQVYLHDLITGKKLEHIKSSFTLNLKTDNDKVIILWTGDTKNRIPKKHTTTFPK